MDARKFEKEEVVKLSFPSSVLPTRTNHVYSELDHPTFQSRMWAEALSAHGANAWLQFKVPDSSDGVLGWI